MAAISVRHGGKYGGHDTRRGQCESGETNGAESSAYAAPVSGFGNDEEDSWG